MNQQARTTVARTRPEWLVRGFVLLAAVLFGSAVTRPLPADQPNIIFMLADDQGWSGLSVPMHPRFSGSSSKVIRTPNLERLAGEGLRFSNAYAPAPVCSPTRIALQLGKSPAQLHWTKAAPRVQGQALIEPTLIRQIPAEEVTIAELLRDAGYHTAHFGKWHLSGGGPGKHGYREHDGDTGNEQAFQFVDPNPVDIFGMAERAEKFMARSLKEKKPFYLQLSWNALHASQNARPATIAKYQELMPGANEKAVTTAAISEDLDEGVGRVLAAVDRLGLSPNTYVIYMSDNGSGGGGRDGLRGGKGGVWEGGIRVPLIVRGPGIKAGTWCDVPVVGYDWYPTFCEWAGIASNRLPGGLEGGSLGAVLAGKQELGVKRSREGLCFHFPHYQGEGGPQSSIRVGNLKLIHFYESDQDMLFDLGVDLQERTDLLSQRPESGKELRTKLDGYLSDVRAQLPTRNPNYQPKESSQDPPNDKRRREAKGEKGTGKVGGGRSSGGREGGGNSGSKDGRNRQGAGDGE